MSNLSGNYLKIALRKLRQNPIYTGINICGLSIGIACCVFIMLFVRDEMGFDRHHEQADRIFRLTRTTSVLSAAPIGPAMQSSLSGVAYTTRITGHNQIMIQYDDDEPLAEKMFFADPAYFNIFDHTFLGGSAESALDAPNSVVLTETTAKRLFGDIEAVGKALTIHDDPPAEFIVTGVIADLPRQSHFNFDLIGSFEHIAAGSERIENWSTNWLFTYGMVQEGVDVASVKAQLPAFFERHTGESWTHYDLQPLLDIRLKSSHLTNDIGVQGREAYVYLFGATGLLILLIACSNFANLTTARSIQRVREIGVRKSLGAHRRQLMRQFFGESLVAVFLATLVACCLVVFCLPFFRNISGKALDLTWQDTGFVALAAVGLIALVGFIAGFYPAFVLSRFNPIRSLKGAHSTTSLGWMRKGLVIFQFTVSVVLIFATTVIYRQLGFIQGAYLGFDKEQVLVMDFGESLTDRYDLVKSEYTRHPNVLSVSASDAIPGQGVSDFLYRPEGVTSDDDLMSFDTYFVDEEYTSLYAIETVRGRPYSPDIATDQEGFLINEAAWAALQGELGPTWAEPIGRQLDFYLPGATGWEVYRTGPVIGVVKDFHYQSLHVEIGPLVMQVLPIAFDYLSVKVNTERLDETLQFLEAQWAALGPERPFEYFFVDDQFDQLYRDESRLAQIFTVFAGLAILIACLGLLGLISISTTQRTKEIGIRRILGASSLRLVNTLTSEYVKLVVLAIGIATPIAFLALGRWLETFAYRVDMNVALFVLIGMMTAGLAWLTMALQSVRTAMANPVESLRHE